MPPEEGLRAFFLPCPPQGAWGCQPCLPVLGEGFGERGFFIGNGALEGSFEGHPRPWLCGRKFLTGALASSSTILGAAMPLLHY